MKITLKNCYPYHSQIERPNIPQLTLYITTPLKKKVKLTGLVDTGYDGNLLLPIDIFLELNIPTLPEDEFRVLERSNGNLQNLPCGIAKIEIERQEYPIVEIEAIDTINEILIGRGILKEINIALLGKQEQLCFIEE